MDALKYGSGMRFVGVNIPKGSTIVLANITFTSGDSRAVGQVRTRISAYDADNPGVFSTSADFDARYADNTDAVVDWDVGAWVLNTEYISTDIKTVIQEIINRVGWSSGNAIVLFWEDFEDRSDHNDEARRYAWSHDGDPTKAPVLSITWTTPFIEPPNKLFGGGFNASAPYVILRWASNLTDINFFEIQNSTDKISWDYLGQSTTNQYTDLQVTNGLERFYRIRACNYTGSVWDNSTFTDINFEKVYFVSGGDGLFPGLAIGISLIIIAAMYFLETRR